jgi:hypothetical protein
MGYKEGSQETELGCGCMRSRVVLRGRCGGYEISIYKGPFAHAMLVDFHDFFRCPLDS